MHLDEHASLLASCLGLYACSSGQMPFYLIGFLAWLHFRCTFCLFRVFNSVWKHLVLLHFFYWINLSLSKVKEIWDVTKCLKKNVGPEARPVENQCSRYQDNKYYVLYLRLHVLIQYMETLEFTEPSLFFNLWTVMSIQSLSWLEFTEWIDVSGCGGRDRAEAHFYFWRSDSEIFETSACLQKDVGCWMGTSGAN